MRRESLKRAAQMRVYRKLRAEFLEAHPACEFPDCEQPSVDLHHKRGRVGADLLDVDHWAALCRPHHEFATVRPAEALALGISERRIGRGAA